MRPWAVAQPRTPCAVAAGTPKRASNCAGVRKCRYDGPAGSSTAAVKAFSPAASGRATVTAVCIGIAGSTAPRSVACPVVTAASRPGSVASASACIPVRPSAPGATAQAGDTVTAVAVSSGAPQPRASRGRRRIRRTSGQTGLTRQAQNYAPYRPLGQVLGPTRSYRPW